MSTIRQRAKAWPESSVPNSAGISYWSSKYFEDGDIWFFTIPIDVIEGDESVNLLLEKKNSAMALSY
ncbi:hypothetical protein [Vibrio splendidus]|uniref:hypothetical protein n=1 Tax=Vibrio splendidus TaxID=29497 RepID=UPI002468343A|nr:hypothetical protein [Vibrio splendidus]MDH5918904.1 hypothetical protein [Vibrio splendidus]